MLFKWNIFLVLFGLSTNKQLWISDGDVKTSLLRFKKFQRIYINYYEFNFSDYTILTPEKTIYLTYRWLIF